MAERYDIVVVGAGPAGSLAARKAAHLGAKVLLLDKRRELGVPVQCGEALAREPLEDLGIKPDPRFIAGEVDTVELISPSGIRVTIVEELAFREKVGFILDRKVFDKHLAVLAAKEGADVKVGTLVNGLMMKNGEITGIEARSFDGKMEIEAKVIIAADGICSRVARWAGIDTALKLNEVESCAQFQMTGIEIKSSNVMEFHFGNKIAPGGYCLARGTKVFCKNTVKPIELLRIGDEVLTCTGFKSIIAIMSRPYTGKIITIVPSMLNDKIRMTPDHLVLVWNEGGSHRWKRADRLAKSRWKGCKRDYLVVPKAKASKITYIDVRKHVKGLIRDRSLPAALTLTPELAMLFGYYLSAGSIKRGCPVISSADQRVIEKISNCARKLGFKFNVKTNYRKSGGKPCTSVIFPKPLGRLFKSLFGGNTFDKRFPHLLYGMDYDLKRIMMKTIFESDGNSRYRLRKSDTISFTTISQRLAYDLWTFLLSMDVVAFLSRDKRRNVHRVRIGKEQVVKIDPSEDIRPRGRNRQEYVITEDVVYLGIRKLSVEEYSGDVWDIQSSGSFCVPFVVHNCWIFPKGWDTANVGIGVLGSRAQYPAIEYLKNFVSSKSELRKGKVIEINCGAVPVGGPLSKTIKDNLLVVGDAARQVNPLTGGGIDSAMRAGDIAGEVAAKAVKENDVSERRLKEYERRWRALLDEKFKRYLKAREVLLSFSDEELDSIAKTLQSAGLRHISLTDILRTIIEAHPEFLQKLKD